MVGRSRLRYMLAILGAGARARGVDLSANPLPLSPRYTTPPPHSPMALIPKLLSIGAPYADISRSLMSLLPRMLIAQFSIISCVYSPIPKTFSLRVLFPMPSLRLP